MQPSSPSLLIIGAGNMARPVIASVIRSGLACVTVITGKSSGKNAAALREYLAKEGIADHSVTIVEREIPPALPPQNIVIYAAKPQQFAEVSAQYTSVIAPDAQVISIAAGLTTEDFKKAWGNQRAIVRAMPHLPRVLCGFYSEDPAARRLAERLLAEMGKAILLPDEDEAFQAFTVHAGSGPAFVAQAWPALQQPQIRALFTQRWQQVAAQQFPPDFAGVADIVYLTIEGTLAFLQQHSLNPSDFAQEVRSAKGVTNIGLLLMGSAPPQEARFGTPEELAAQNAIAAQFQGVAYSDSIVYALLGSYARARAMASEPQQCTNPLYLLGGQSLTEIQRAGDSLF